MEANELAAQIKNTKAFIDANVVTLILTPVRKSIDGSGTHYVDDDPRAPQEFRLIDQSTARERAANIFRASDGQDRIAEFMLLGLPDASVGLYDHWDGEDGKTYELNHIFPANGYEMRATVVSR